MPGHALQACPSESRALSRLPHRSTGTVPTPMSASRRAVSSVTSVPLVRKTREHHGCRMCEDVEASALCNGSPPSTRTLMTPSRAAARSRKAIHSLVVSSCLSCLRPPIGIAGAAVEIAGMRKGQCHLERRVKLLRIVKRQEPPFADQALSSLAISGLC